MITIQLPKQVEMIMGEISDYGHSVHIVGGCVRDSLLGISPKDWDIATSMKPDVIVEVFKNLGYTVVPTGIKHGTVTIVIDGEHFEVTTYRKDGEYSDGRRPDEVVFTHLIEEDLARRDFTINAMACNENGLVDPFDGLHDLQAKIIRAVGSPSDRFKEDGLRMLRAIRFSATLGFDIAPSTYHAICENCHLLNQISVERKREELYKILLSDSAHYGVRHLISTGLMDYIIPEISNMTFHKLDEIPQFFGLRLAYLLLDFYETKVRDILNNLKVDNETKKLIVSGIGGYNEIEDKVLLTSHEMKYLIRNYGSRAFWGSLLIAKALHGDKYNHMINLYQIIMRNNKQGKEPIWIQDLALDGNDVKNAGYKGKEIGYMLNELLSYVIYFPEKNNRDSLFAYMEGDVC